MKPVLLLAVMLGLYVLPVQGQGTCEIDLSDAIARLQEAQSAADDGDKAAALLTLSDVQEQFSVLIEACAQANAADDALPVTLEYPDGLFRFNHPDGWTSLSPFSGIFVLSNNQTAANTIVESNFGEAIPAGSQIVIAVYGDIKSLFGENDFDSYLERIQDEGFTSEAAFVSPQKVTIQDFAGFKFSVSSNLFDGSAYALDLGNNQIAFFVAMTPRGEYPEFESTFEAIIASIQVGRKQTSANQTQSSTTEIIANTGKPLSEITYAQALSIGDLIDDVNFRNAVLSPDGTRIAWADPSNDGQVCLYEIANENTQCNPIPEIFGGAIRLLLWSPDSRYLAFSQDGLRLFQEPDIWVLDTDRQVFANRTDDNINRWRFGREPSSGDSRGPLWFDYTFAWGPDGNIYFVRFDAPDSSNFDEGTTGLYRVSPENGVPELIYDLTNDYERFAIYQQEQHDLNGVMAVSPDATQIAFIVLERDFDSFNSGVWVLSLSGDEAPRQVVRATEFIGGLPSDVSEDGKFLLPMGLAWSPDQSGLYVFARDPLLENAVGSILYHIALDNNQLTPLTDFSEYTSAEINQPDKTTGSSLRYEVPRAAVMSPDGTTPLVFHFETEIDQAGLSAITLSEGHVERMTLLEFEYKSIPGMTASVAADGKVLMLGALILPQD